MTRSVRLFCGGLTLLVAAVGCDATKSSNPLSPSVAAPIPGVTITAPTPVEPSFGATIAADVQPLTLKVQNATSSGPRPLTYSFEVAADIDFSSKVYTRQGIEQGGSGSTSLQLPDPLEAGRTYYWRARADDGNNTGPFGSAHFQIYTPIGIEIPAAISPANGARLTTRRPELKAQNAKRTGPVGNLAYSFQISTSEAFTDTVALVTVGEQPVETKFTLGQELDYDRLYYWRVRAYDPTVSSGWSATQAFRTPVTPPGPVISCPANVAATSSSGSPVAVSYTPPRMSGGVAPLVLACSPGSGSAFPVGGTTVSCTATDALSRTERCTFSVTVTRASAPPSPPPSPPPSGGTCNSGSPYAIVQCERGKYGFMSPGQTVNFLQATAVSLNRNNIGGGPFGILRKSGGTSCNGYSCDIICAGQGNGQAQWDVLGDAEGAQIPDWSGPNRVPNIRVDVCEIQ